MVLQTYLPDHYAVQAASQHDFEGFMRRELAFRRQHAYPPFVRLVRLERRDTDARRVEEEAQRMGRKVAEWLEQGGLRATRMIGPAPCFFARQNGMFRWQIVLAGPDPLAALRGRDLGEWRVQVDPPALL